MEGGGGGGAGRAIHFFAWVDFLGLQMTWIMYEFYHLIVEEFPLMIVCFGQIF